MSKYYINRLPHNNANEVDFIPASLRRQLMEFILVKEDFIHDTNISFYLCNMCVKKRKYNVRACWRMKARLEGGRFDFVSDNKSICQYCYETLTDDLYSVKDIIEVI
jgi:hypothetical protein